MLSSLFPGKCRCLSPLIGAVVLLAIFTDNSFAQKLSLDLILQPQLTNAGVFNLSGLGISSNGQGAPLFNLVIRNNTNVPQNRLYLEVELSSQKVGTIADVYEQSGRPFKLSAGQTVTASNNQLQNGLPGVQESIFFNGGLTSEGEQFINGLSGSARLPADIYTVTLSLYQGDNSRGGGLLMASVDRTFGENISTDTNVDLYLLQPGGEVGSDETITSKLPVFRWDGPNNLNYRLLIVKDDGQQSPEAMLQAARETEPTLVNGRTGTGSLLDFEIVDATTNNTTFSMPPSGVKSLEPGAKYYWQVITNRNQIGGTESIPSEIWEFTLAEDGSFVASSSNISKEVQNALNILLGRERSRQLSDQGYKFISITIDGQAYEGAAAIQKLQEYSDSLKDGKINIVIN